MLDQTAKHKCEIECIRADYVDTRKFNLFDIPEVVVLVRERDKARAEADAAQKDLRAMREPKRQTDYALDLDVQKAIPDRKDATGTKPIRVIQLAHNVEVPVAGQVVNIVLNKKLTDTWGTQISVKPQVDPKMKTETGTYLLKYSLNKNDSPDKVFLKCSVKGNKIELEWEYYQGREKPKDGPNPKIIQDLEQYIRTSAIKVRDGASYLYIAFCQPRRIDATYVEAWDSAIDGTEYVRVHKWYQKVRP